MQSSAARKIESQNTPERRSHHSLRMIMDILQDAREFIIGCKEDLELLNFLHKYQSGKTHKRSFSSHVRRFIIRFPLYWQLRIKAYSDMVVGVVALIVALPIMGLLAMVVKLSSKGPALYQQERVGRFGRSFMIYKFRTMYIDAETKSGPVWAQENDPRITPVGRFLRKTHLDELPQLINVVRGEMSIVGPRPERPYFVEKLKMTIPQYEQRLYVKPGITGLAQVRHKYDETVTDVKRKVKYDLVYIKKMCLMLDLKVLLWTVGVVITGKGAR